jgi:hemerythrin
MEQQVWPLQWDDNMSVGIREIDQEHQGLLLLLNRLNDSIESCMEIAEIRRRMHLILDDWQQHASREEKLFRAEEEFFRKWRYPATDEHVRKHEEVSKSLHAIMSDFSDANGEGRWATACRKVRVTLIDHLLIEDMKYRDYYRSVPP